MSDGESKPVKGEGGEEGGAEHINLKVKGQVLSPRAVASVCPRCMQMRTAPEHFCARSSSARLPRSRWVVLRHKHCCRELACVGASKCMQNGDPSGSLYRLPGERGDVNNSMRRVSFRRLFLDAVRANASSKRSEGIEAEENHKIMEGFRRSEIDGGGRMATSFTSRSRGRPS